MKKTQPFLESYDSDLRKERAEQQTASVSICSRQVVTGPFKEQSLDMLPATRVSKYGTAAFVIKEAKYV